MSTIRYHELAEFSGRNELLPFSYWPRALRNQFCYEIEVQHRALLANRARHTHESSLSIPRLRIRSWRTVAYLLGVSPTKSTSWNDIIGFVGANASTLQDVIDRIIDVDTISDAKPEAGKLTVSSWNLTGLSDLLSPGAKE